MKKCLLALLALALCACNTAKDVTKVQKACCEKTEHEPFWFFIESKHGQVECYQKGRSVISIPEQCYVFFNEEGKQLTGASARCALLRDWKIGKNATKRDAPRGFFSGLCGSDCVDIRIRIYDIYYDERHHCLNFLVKPSNEERLPSGHYQDPMLAIDGNTVTKPIHNNKP